MRLGLSIIGISISLAIILPTDIQGSEQSPTRNSGPNGVASATPDATSAAAAIAAITPAKSLNDEDGVRKLASTRTAQHRRTTPTLHALPEMLSWEKIRDLPTLEMKKEGVRKFTEDKMEVVKFDINKHERPETFLQAGETDFTQAFIRMRNVTKAIYLTEGKTYRVNVKNTVFTSGKKFIGNKATLDVHYYNLATALFGSNGGTYDFDSMYINHTIEAGGTQSITPDKLEPQYRNIGHNVCPQNSFVWAVGIKLNHVISELLTPAPTVFNRADKPTWRMSAERVNMFVGFNVDINECFLWNNSRCFCGSTVWAQDKNATLKVKNSFIYGMHDDETLANYGKGTCTTDIDGLIMYTASKMKFSSGIKASTDDVSTWTHDSAIRNSDIFFQRGRRYENGVLCGGIDVGYWSTNSLRLENCNFSGDVQLFIYTSGYTGKPSTLTIADCDFSNIACYGWNSNNKGKGYFIQNTTNQYDKDIYTITIDNESKATVIGAIFH